MNYELCPPLDQLEAVFRQEQSHLLVLLHTAKINFFQHRIIKKNTREEKRHIFISFVKLGYLQKMFTMFSRVFLKNYAGFAFLKDLNQGMESFAQFWVTEIFEGYQ